MASWTNHKARIYAYGSGSSTPGSLLGTITRILANGAEGENNLDEPGSGYFKIHGADTPSLSLCQEFRLARVTAESSITGQEHEVCCFIIREMTPEIVGRHVVYTIKGPDFIGNLMWANIGFNVISDGAGEASETPITDCLQLSDKAWTVTEHGSTTLGGIHVGSGETAFVVLITLLQQLKAHISFPLVNNPAFKLHVWYEFEETSGTGFDALTLRESATPADYADDPSVAIITESIQVTLEQQEVFTRAYIYGAGMGASRFTIEDLVFHSLDPDFPGFSVNTSQSLIINTALEASIPPIATTKQFPTYEPEDPSSAGSVIAAARGLFWSGLTWLKYRGKSVITYYEIPNLVIHGDIVPGQLVRVIYNRASPVNASGSMVTTQIIDLDEDLIVLGIRHKIGANGIRYTTLTVGDTPKRPSTGLNMMAEKLKELEQTINHTNAGSGGGGSTEPGDTTYLWASGSGPTLTGDLIVEDLVTIDGVDISAHVGDPDAHHVPGTISHNSPNATTGGVEYHAVEASAAPGAAASLLKSSPAGKVTLVTGEFTNLYLTDRDSGQKYNIFIDDGLMFVEPV